MDYNAVIGELERQGLITPMGMEEVERHRIFNLIDSAWLFAEVPLLAVSKKPRVPSVLLWNVAVYRVPSENVGTVKEKIGA